LGRRGAAGPVRPLGGMPGCAGPKDLLIAVGLAAGRAGAEQWCILLI
jgi:hypothetical protein